MDRKWVLCRATDDQLAGSFVVCSGRIIRCPLIIFKLGRKPGDTSAAREGETVTELRYRMAHTHPGYPPVRRRRNRLRRVSPRLPGRLFLSGTPSDFAFCGQNIPSEGIYARTPGFFLGPISRIKTLIQ